MITEPSRRSPLFSASSIIDLAARSLTLPAGFKYSSFTSTLAERPSSFSRFSTSIRGVFPINSVMFLYTAAIIAASFLNV